MLYGFAARCLRTWAQFMAIMALWYHSSLFVWCYFPKKCEPKLTKVGYCAQPQLTIALASQTIAVIRHKSTITFSARHG